MTSKQVQQAVVLGAAAIAVIFATVALLGEERAVETQSTTLPVPARPATEPAGSAHWDHVGKMLSQAGAASPIALVSRAHSRAEKSVLDLGDRASRSVLKSTLDWFLQTRVPNNRPVEVRPGSTSARIPPPLVVRRQQPSNEPWQICERSLEARVSI